MKKSFLLLLIFAAAFLLFTCLAVTVDRGSFTPQPAGEAAEALAAGETAAETVGQETAVGFSALNFTDSRSRFQFYDLQHLWDDLNTALDAGLTLWHPSTEPVSAAELYHYLSGKEFCNELPGTPADYDYRTIHAGLFGGSGGYIASKEQVMSEIKKFTDEYKGR